MDRSRRSQRKELVSAQVFLRSTSGRSLRESAGGPLSADLAPFRAKEADVAAVFRHFQSLGFTVYRDELGLALTIEASPSVFAKVFRIPASQLSSTSAAETTRLDPPNELREMIEEILVTPKPEFFQP